MKKNSDNIKDNDTIEAIVGEVLTEQEVEEKLSESVLMIATLLMY